jgi:hypothetical protein
MTTILTRLTLCFALFYSVSSAAYNEAMCILIKQEMQQHSNNKTGQSYRSAARDYTKNCDRPKQVQTKANPLIIKPAPVLTPPQTQAPAAVKRPAEQLNTQLTKQPLNLTDEQKQQLAEQLDASNGNGNSNNTITINAEPTSNNTANNSHTQSTQTEPAIKQKIVQPMQTNVPVKIQNELVKTPAAKLAPVITPGLTPVTAPVLITQNPRLLLLPSLLLLIVVLIGVMVLVRLRRIKDRKTPPAPVLPISTSSHVQNEPLVKVSPKKPIIKTADVTNEHIIKNEDTALKAQKTKTEQTVITAVEQNKNNEPPNLQASTTEPAPLDQQNSANFSEAKQKPEPNTAEFEAAAKTTLERIKNARSFNEPHVREFDPTAQPIKKSRKHVMQPVEPVQNKVAQSNVIKPKATNPNQITAKAATQPKTAPKASTEQGFKEPEVRIFDPSAPLPSKKVKPTKPQEPKIESAESEKSVPKTPASEATEPKADAKTQSSNPFANLSLDKSWDPNSTEKPTVEERKRAPKSQALIDAEARAKKLQTKE